MSYNLPETILKGKRYYLPGEKSYEELCRRVARWLATAEAILRESEREASIWEERFFTLFKEKLFLGNSPLLFNAGIGCLLKGKCELLYKGKPTLSDYKEIYKNRIEGESGSACFVVPIGDSLEEIYDALRAQGLIFKTGGGVGIDFSPLRPSGDSVKEVSGAASGPIEFMKLFDLNTEVIKSGYRRRGANMGILSANHPDIISFIRAKSDERAFKNFNLSIKINSRFMESVLRKEPWDLVNPRNGSVWKRVKASELFDEIVNQAWETGDPGLIFIDRINLFNDLPGYSRIEATNPCGEEPLHPWGSCNLGSIDIAKFSDKDEINWNELGETVKVAVRALNAVIDMSLYPLSQIDKYARGARPIGLGIMGFAHALAKLGISYDSEEAIRLLKKILSFIYYVARSYSNELSLRFGSFPLFDKSIYKISKRLPIAWEEEEDREVKEFWKEMKIDWENLSKQTCEGTFNSRILTIAPTGTISMIAETSSGIEPIFSRNYKRRVEINGEEKIIDIEDPSLRCLSDEKRATVKTAHEIDPQAHVKVLASAQRYVDAGVSKTVNIKEEASKENVREIFLSAWSLGCKGITVYRDRSKRKQVITCSCEIQKK
ncbi:MAG: adenosylcobalamin-dependent ribonucleoside-diphosphate reductase [Synergistetes bacterium]|nr:adenosylcobalamin-dependent ribonucleoside-diphosphate reductase [Synergistota bacterium]MDW8192865.1 adenosylcobalamin-dependent ribonucleoside-diphosphate reductase [Synergistota bacterium]